MWRFVLLVVIVFVTARPSFAQLTAATALNNASAYTLSAATQPAASQWYTDPDFGTLIQRLTDASNADSSTVPYSYWPPWNTTSTLFWVAVWPVGGIGGNPIAQLYDFDPVTGSASNPRVLQVGSPTLVIEGLIWSRLDANLLYGLGGNLTLYSLVPGGTPSIVKNLAARVQATLPTASFFWQMSMGGVDRYFAFAVRNAGAVDIGLAVYDLQTDTLYCRDLSAIGGTFDEAHLTRDGAALVISANPGTAFLWDFAAHPTAPFLEKDFGVVIAHEDFGPSTQMAASTNPEVSGHYGVWDLASFQAGTKTVTQANRFVINVKATDALVDWPDVHWSWQNLTDSTDPTVAYLSSDVGTDQTAAWRAYFDEIIKVWTDGSGAGPSGSKWRRLAHHRSEIWGTAGSNYRSYPKGAVDPSGRWYAYSSNWQKAATIGGVTRVDVYLLKIPTEAEFAAGMYLDHSTVTGSAALSGKVSVP